MMRIVSSRSHLALAFLAGTLLACGGASTATKKTPTNAAGPNAGGIDGVVLDAQTGTAVSFVSVIAKAADSKRTYSHTTDGTGHFTLKALPPGTYQVMATYGSHTTRHINVPVKRTGSTHIHMRIDMRVKEAKVVPYKHTPAVPPPPQRVISKSSRGLIEGLVRNAKTKELLPGTVVGASSSVLPEPRLAVVDAKGRYRLPGLPPGTYVLSIYYTVVDRGNVEVRRGGVEVNKGKATIIDLMLDTEKH